MNRAGVAFAPPRRSRSTSRTISASSPKPAQKVNHRSRSPVTSLPRPMRRSRPARSRSRTAPVASIGSAGRPKARANTFALPPGTTASRGVSGPTPSRKRPDTHSLTVPSPPTATTRSNSSMRAWAARSAAWPRLWVSATSSLSSLPRARTMTSRVRELMAVALGLVTNRARTPKGYARRPRADDFGDTAGVGRCEHRCASRWTARTIFASCPCRVTSAIPMRPTTRHPSASRCGLLSLLPAARRSDLRRPPSAWRFIGCQGIGRSTSVTCGRSWRWPWLARSVSVLWRAASCARGDGRGRRRC